MYVEVVTGAKSQGTYEYIIFLYFHNILTHELLKVGYENVYKLYNYMKVYEKIYKDQNIFNFSHGASWMLEEKF
jgi:hypothetical protein